MRNGFTRHRSRVQDLEGTVHFLPSIWLTATVTAAYSRVFTACVEFIDRVWPNTVKWLVMYSSMTLQRQVGSEYIYCDGWVSCPASAACYFVWQPLRQSTTSTSRHRHDMTSVVQTTLLPQQTRNRFATSHNRTAVTPSLIQSGRGDFTSVHPHCFNAGDVIFHSKQMVKDKYPNFEVGLKCIIMVF